MNHNIWVSSSPTPGYCYWDNEVPTPYFHATNADGYGNMECPHFWLAHCDSDSMTFHGTWPVIDSPYVTGAEYYVDLSCSVEITSETLLAASRTGEGALDTDQHTLVVEYADGTDEILLEDGTGPDQHQLILLPGTYVIHLHVHAYKHKTFSQNLYPYSGYVSLKLEEPGHVAVQPITWDSLKAAYSR